MKTKELPSKFKTLLNSKDKEVNEYMISVMNGLIKDYGAIDDSFYVSLKLIRDNYEIYNKCQKKINEEGLIRKDSEGRTTKNQCFTMFYKSQDEIQSLLKSFALTPMTKSKMKALTKGTDEVSPLDSFLLEE